ncbi:uncharacterized protein KY384_000295 [Bacidia gigantensis]|uniref:uncharacterized protein n=1 Tax=Bacidia gigantensis TaxID=2732470 RepID=UPI001D05AD69|nr:uncharacterized protein KY384_000295 [Bacidia gigantensis]KAG8526302.1 hypothetical protein KY384_000295 [Bacidia gigantensis]
MKTSISLTSLAFLASSVLAIPTPDTSASGLEKCSATSITPCVCPAGTTYRESVTFSVIGAAANDVTNVISSFFHTDWLGVSPYKTSGTDNVPGAVRTSKLPTLAGIFDITEVETVYHEDKKFGGFVEKFEQEQSTVPVKYANGSGEIAGYWITLAAQHVFQYETAIEWSVYACETNYPRNFAKFHEEALKNATDILTKSNKIKGKNVDPFSIQTFLN